MHRFDLYRIRAANGAKNSGSDADFPGQGTRRKRRRCFREENRARRTPVTAQPTLKTGETRSVIASDKVEGTAVYRPNGDKLGRIERVMIDKETGKVAYALMSFGGFMGIGRDYYPLPWSLLKFNPRLDGYEINISEQQLTEILHP
jgi:sporulation protein YlmC with PRC-barrel domain